MTKAKFSPDQFATVADFLLIDLGDVDENEWQDCEDSRFRTAISRSYYSVFLSLKQLVLDARPTLAFPKKDAHAKLRRAVESALGSNRIVTDLRSLLKARAEADYDIAAPPYTPTLAESHVDAAIDALDRINKLTIAEVANIGYELSLTP